MSRLTKSLRERMTRCVLDNAFSEKLKAAKKDKCVVADKIYVDIYGPHIKAMEALPAGFFESGHHLYISISGQRHCLQFTESKLSAHNHDYHNMAKIYVGDELVAIEYQKAVNACDDIEKQRKSMAHEVEAILNSVQTFKKLWEVWPESKSLLEKFESKPTVAMLPAIQFERVNAALGLPVGVV